MHIIAWMLITYLLAIIFKIVQGPTLWDRFLGFSIASSKIIMLIVVVSSINDTSYLLDLALIYALFGFLGEIFLILFLAERSKKGKKI